MKRILRPEPCGPPGPSAAPGRGGATSPASWPRLAPAARGVGVPPHPGFLWRMGMWRRVRSPGPKGRWFTMGDAGGGGGVCGTESMRSIDYLGYNSWVGASHTESEPSSRVPSASACQLSKSHFLRLDKSKLPVYHTNGLPLQNGPLTERGVALENAKRVQNPCPCSHRTDARTSAHHDVLHQLAPEIHWAQLQSPHKGLKNSKRERNRFDRRETT